MKKPKIIYIYDALCGWCYGFSPVIRRFHQHYADEFDFDVLSGGMMTGERVKPVSESMAYIEQAYKVVEARTGVRFGDDYLTNLLRPGTYMSDSEKPGMAMTLFKAILPGPDQVLDAPGLAFVFPVILHFRAAGVIENQQVKWLRCMLVKTFQANL